MDISEPRVLLRGAVKIFEAGLQSKMWDIHGMPHFVTTMHHKECDTCEAYALHIVEVLDINLNGSLTSPFCSTFLHYTFSILKSILFPSHL